MQATKQGTLTSGEQRPQAQELLRFRVGCTLELAGAFSNDGFKLRDGHWVGTLAPNESKLIAVNLYAGNEYWFSAGATEQAKKLTVEVFDETGAPVTTQIFNSGTKAAAGYPVTNSGQYFIRVRLAEGEGAGVCFLYSYK